MSANDGYIHYYLYPLLNHTLLSSISTQIFSTEKEEYINLILSSVESRACNIIGSSFDSNTIRLIQLPFKPALVVDSLVLDYKGNSRNELTDDLTSSNAGLPSERGLLSERGRAANFESPLAATNKAGAEAEAEAGAVEVDSSNTAHPNVVAGTVFVDVRLELEEIVLNVTPSLNAVFTGAYCQFSQTFIDEAENTRLTKAEKVRSEKRERKIRKKDLARRNKTLRRLWDQIDYDGSDALDREEVKQIIINLFKNEQKMGEGTSSNITKAELQREMDHFMDVVDVNHDDQISFEGECVNFLKILVFQSNPPPPPPPPPPHPPLQNSTWP